MVKSNESNQNKGSSWINLEIVDITTKSALNFSHDFLSNTPTAAHVDPSSSLTSHPEPTANEPEPGFNIIVETPKSFRRFERIEIDDLENEIVLETERNINMRLQTDLDTFKSECEN